MPRELVHWCVLDKVEKQLSKRNLFGCTRIFNSQRPSAYLGAMVHDAAYYYKFGGHSFEQTAARLHGTYRNDTFEPLRRIASYAFQLTEREEQDIVWALLSGMVSHMATDIVFHPMVFNLTGDYYERDLNEREAARARHRIFEVYLDAWVGKRYQTWNEGSFGPVRKELKWRFDLICRALAAVESSETGQIDPENVMQWRGSINYMTMLQKVFLSKTLGFVVNTANRLFSGQLDGIEGLFAFGRSNTGEVFSAALIFRHPVTGEEIAITLEELIDQAVDRSLTYLEHLEPLIVGESKSVDATLGQLPGLSLNLGMEDVGRSDAKYFSPVGVDLPGLLRIEL